MRRNIFAPAALVAGLVLAAGACDNGLVEANEDPNAPTDVGAEFLVPQSIRAAVEQTFGAGQMLSHTATWAQHAVQIQYPDEGTGQVRSASMQGYWDGYYSGPLRDIRTVVQKGREAERPNIEGIGLIWESYIFHLVTDAWGDVPYSEALRGDEGITTPAYDPQEDIYHGLLETLTAAQSMLTAGGGSFGAGDLLYGNDITKWRRFANSLRMRLAMRLSEVDPATARTEFAAAVAAGGFESNADNAMMQWAAPPYENPLFENWQGRDDHGVSATLIDSLKSLSDPRLELYAEPAAEDGAYRGLESGYYTPPLSISWYSRIGDFWRADGAGTPSALLTYSEVLFLMAEAAQRGWISGDPADLYQRAIRANMNQYDDWSPANAPTDAEIDAYLAQPGVAYSAANGRTMIQYQLWLSLFMNGSEAWSTWRRTGVPHLEVGPEVVTSRIPVRFSYAANEQSLNAANLSAAVQRQGGGNDLVTPLWWMEN